MKLSPSIFQKKLLAWFDVNGRKTLPWQQNKTPYRVWISEIMLQQTQVTTVIPYFQRFMDRFPNLSSLANAKEDDVLHLWAGLGYYSRARNLQKAAKMLMEKHAGKLPETLAELKALPGIGASTAGAILAIGFNQPATILDGNVKRVLARLHGIEDPINLKNTESKLWQLAIQYTPKTRSADYTQAMMDLGATLCMRSKPNCKHCPFIKHCIAYQQDKVDLLPAKIATKKIPTRSATFLILKKNTHVLLYKRPAQGVWSGLYSLPEIPGLAKSAAIRTYCKKHFQLTIANYTPLPAFKHTFTHYHLHISPILLEIGNHSPVVEDNQQIWYNLHQPKSIGLPKPIQSILRGLR